MSHVKALEKAKIALMTKPDTAFFCELAFSLKYKWSESISTAGTDGVYMILNPHFFMDLSKEEQLGLILHETLHVAYMHMIRGQNKDKRIYNYAADYVINDVILERGFKLPKDGLHDIKYRGMSSEEVYELLIQEAKENPNSSLASGEGVPGTGEDILPSSEELADDMSLEDHIQQTIIRASIRSKEQNDNPGTIPGDIQIFLDKLLKPKLPWSSILRKYLQQFSKSDYTFKKPNRRFFPAHYLPSMFSTSLMDIAVAVDTSGSVSDKEFMQFISEIVSIFKMTKPKKISLIQFDTALKSVNEIRNFSDLMQVKFKGRGGTMIEPVIKWANENKPQLLLVFTDGHFDICQMDTKQNLLWIIHDNPDFKAPKGKVIHYGID